MTNLKAHQNNIEKEGFSIINDVFSEKQVQNLIEIIENITAHNANFRQDNALFAVRNFLNEVPEIQSFIWTKEFKNLISDLLGEQYFLVKAIYFDKPPMSNWLVAWHQDTKISVVEKRETEGFGSWSLKQGLASVQPPLNISNDIFTLRIHLDDCDESNGALKVVPKTHILGFLSDEAVLNIEKKEVICSVKKGGILAMKPLLLHASSKSISERNRRVIHLEFCSKQLPNGLAWREVTH